MLPVYIVLPSLIGIVLGPSVAIPSKIIIESFANYVTDVERCFLKDALECNEPFNYTVRAKLLNILSRFGYVSISTHPLPNPNPNPNPLQPPWFG